LTGSDRITLTGVSGREWITVVVSAVEETFSPPGLFPAVVSSPEVWARS